MSVEKSGYQPSEDEIIKAEEMMTSEDQKMSDDRQREGKIGVDKENNQTYILDKKKKLGIKERGRFARFEKK